MELIRQDTDYAMRAMTCMGRTADGGKSEDSSRVTAESLSESQQIPLSFCHKILRKLVSARLAVSRPGRAGGFRLARRPANIRLLDIVQAIQGPVAVSTCMMDLDACPRQAGCPVSRKWRALQKGIFEFLKTTTLADVVKGEKK